MVGRHTVTSCTLRYCKIWLENRWRRMEERGKCGFGLHQWVSFLLRALFFSLPMINTSLVIFWTQILNLYEECSSIYGFGKVWSQSCLVKGYLPFISCWFVLLLLLHLLLYFVTFTICIYWLFLLPLFSENFTFNFQNFFSKSISIVTRWQEGSW